MGYIHQKCDKARELSRVGSGQYLDGRHEMKSNLNCGCTHLDTLGRLCGAGERRETIPPKSLHSTTATFSEKFLQLSSQLGSPRLSAYSPQALRSFMIWLQFNTCQWLSVFSHFFRKTHTHSKTQILGNQSNINAKKKVLIISTARLGKNPQAMFLF